MLNVKKTKVMKTDKTIGPVNITDNSTILETVNKYEYLGSTEIVVGRRVCSIKIENIKGLHLHYCKIWVRDVDYDQPCVKACCG